MVTHTALANFLNLTPHLLFFPLTLRPAHTPFSLPIFSLSLSLSLKTVALHFSPPTLLLFHFTNILYPNIPAPLPSTFAILFLIQAPTCCFSNTSTTSTSCWTQRIPLYIQDYLSQRTPRIDLCPCQDRFFAVNINLPGLDSNLVTV